MVSPTEEKDTNNERTASHGKEMEVSPYTHGQMQAALDALWHDSHHPDRDAAHIFGYGNDATHQLSMLQIVTATRILDYAALLLRDGDDDEHGGAHTTRPPSQQDLEQQARQQDDRLNLADVIQAQAPAMALAAEFKRASPSKGLIASSAAQMNVVTQAVTYARAGANIISVLTEARWFRGSLEDLRQARRATETIVAARPAILCKEFITNEYMIAEAAAAGADTVLLIVAVLPAHLLQRLIAYSRRLGLEPLVEVHANVELQVALDAGARVIGVNNRNLHTFQLDLATAERVAAALQARNVVFAHGDRHATHVLCALSGMSTAHDVDRYRQAGLGMVLIGESLMRATHPASAIRALCLHPDDCNNNAQQEHCNGIAVAAAAYIAGTQIIKVCGITNAPDASVACQAGANLIGVIFAERSKRKVTVSQAQAVVAAVRAFGERDAAYAFELPRTANEHTAPLPHLITCARVLASACQRRPLVVGVFQDQSPAFIADMVQQCGLDLVQLHGAEGFAAAHPSNCGGVPALRVVDVVVDKKNADHSSGQTAPDAAVDKIMQQLTTDPIGILLDTAIKGQNGGGGTSQTFDWNLATELQKTGLPVLIAGGLTPENVADVVGTHRPFGVDVSSGVEIRAGQKDYDKTRQFVRTARQTAAVASKGI